MVRKTKAEAEATRQQLLDAAERVFLAQGVARTSLQQVAAEAGLTRGAIYWHFKDKADLYSAMMDRVTLPCECAMAEAMAASPADARATLLQLALAPLAALVSEPQVQRVFSVAMHYTEYTEELAPVRERHREAVAGFVAQLQQQLEHLGVGPLAHGSALGLFALIDGLMRQWTLSPGSFDLLAVGEHCARSYLAGVALKA